MSRYQSRAPGSRVWLTPPALLAALGAFDLDPCAVSEPRPWPTAARHYTREDNGLLRPWEGRVWLNPPYGDGMAPWMRRMAAHGWGTALLFARTETRDFFETVWGAAAGLLFIRGRVRFLRPDGSLGMKSPAPSVLVAYGADDLERLADSGLSGQLVPLRLPRGVVIVGLAQTWVQLVAERVRAAGGPVTVAELYEALRHHPKARGRQHLRAKLRQSLQLGPFQRVGRGTYAPVQA